jgi:hypothetical protein
VPVEITLANVNTAFSAVGGERERDWDKLDDMAKDVYARRLQEKGREPVELSVLLTQSEAARRWAEVHWLVRAEFCAWISEARTGFIRRRRAAAALRHAPKENV